MRAKFDQRILYIALVALLIFISFLVYSIFFASTEIKLYFSDQQAQYLEAEFRTIKDKNLYESSIKELIAGPKNEELSATLPSDIQLLGIEVSDGLAEVDFNQDLIRFHSGGSTGERMTVYSIVNTLAQFEEIQRVQILIEGEIKETLVGHLDISQPIEYNKRIVDNL